MSTRTRNVARLLVLAVLATLLHGSDARAQKFNFGVKLADFPCDDYSTAQAVVWYGHDSRMSMADLAAYCAPVIWFSPDEPLLAGGTGKAITIPEAFPFETPAAGPVVYYRVRSILMRSDAGKNEAFAPDSTDRGQGMIDLRYVAGIDLDFFFYYSSEAGLGVHKHDVESAQFQLVFPQRAECDGKYLIVVSRVVGKAHGIQWYDNTLSVDEFTRFPMHIMSEEGKHASCTDKNADGYFTPGYDVNRRVNDAWGVRDVISSGSLFTGGFQSWMAKVRRPEHRVFPPLPEDSSLRKLYTQDGVYAPDNAIYELRPFPSAEHADHELEHFISDKGDPNWPQVEKGSRKQFGKWVDRESFVKSLSVGFYADGNYGISFSFPFFVVKNLEDPMGGGFITQRMAFTDHNGRDFTWMANYSASASRWIDPYFAAGAEWDREDSPTGSGLSTDTHCVLETGLKFRAGLAHTPFKFMTKVADFWGLRFGIKSTGFFDIDSLRYVIEVGAGTW